jgi:tocopherol O-methyltransferase
LEEAFRLLKKGGRLIIVDGFAAKEDYDKSQAVLMRKWLYGWGVNSLETTQSFETYLRDIGFKRISYSNITKHIVPLSKRLYYLSFPGLFFGKVVEFVGIRTPIQTGNIIATRY